MAHAYAALWITDQIIRLDNKFACCIIFCCIDEENKNKDGAVFALEFIQSNNLLTNFEYASNEHYVAKLLEPLIISYSEEHFCELVYKRLHEHATETSDFEGRKIAINGIELDLDNKRKAIPIGNNFVFTSNDKKQSFYSVHSQFKPSYGNPRIKQQQGCFTFHGGKFFDGKEYIPMHRMEEEAKFLIKIKITPANKKSILEELKLLGITEATLFPEMEYQAKHIKELYAYK